MTDKLYFGATTACRVNDQSNTFMRTHLLKKLSVLFCLGLMLLAASSRVAAQILVGPNGSTNQTFDALPTVASGWSGVSVGGAGGDYTTTGNLDNHVNTNTLASAVNVALTGNGVVPPDQFATPRWNSTGFYLQTRPTGNAYQLLMATIKNNTGSNVTQVTLMYDWDQKNANPVNESIAGHRVYYSVTGARNSWTLVPALSTFTTTSTAASLSATFSVGAWTNGATLYVLWADDNGPGGTTDPKEGAYTIDNFLVKAVPATAPVIITHPQNQSVSPLGSATFSVVAVGANPLYYQWLKNSNIIANATNSSYTINNATISDQGFYSVIVSNSFGSVTSSNAFLTVSCSTPVSITAQPQPQNVIGGATLSISVGTAGTVPITYQWFRNGIALGNATNATYSKPNAATEDSGLYSVIVSNCGASVTSSNAFVSVSVGPNTVLLGFTNTFWRYNQTGTDLGPDWMKTNYNDNIAGWSSGRGLLAFETDSAAVIALTNTVLSLTGSGGARNITYYFRTTFNITNTDLAPVFLVSSNYIDDGMVVYLNGKEAFRYNMSPGTVRFDTLAIAANPGGEGVIIVSNLPPTLMVTGTNVLAVEVHQNSSTSSDIVFGMSLALGYVQPGPLAIVKQPIDVVQEETKQVEFELGVQGQPAYFQWYREGVAVSNGTANPFVIQNVTAGDAGAYYAVATNFFNSVTSIVVTLTVIADTNPPALLEADGSLYPTNVLVTFSEFVSAATATNLSRYQITNTATGTALPITRAVLQDGTNVLLTTSPRGAGTNYILVVNGIRDISPSAHLIATNSSIPIRSFVKVFPLDFASWFFYDPFPPAGDNPDIGTSWRDFNYAYPGFWSFPGQGIFYDTSEPDDVPGPANTALSQSTAVVSYFRLGFNSQFSPGGLRLDLTHVMDDGGVIYLNGAEVLRFNMPTGAITYQTVASSTIEPSLRILTNIPVSMIRQGSNVIAVELHQVQSVDQDKVFGLQLDASIQSYAIGPIAITGGPDDQRVVEGAPATFKVVQAGGATFQWQQTNNINGWTNIVGATNDSYRIASASLSMNGARFRVAISNATSGIVSSNATLFVGPDPTGPQLLSGFANSNNTIVVTFTEPVTAATANTSGNYTVTNSAGQLFAVTSAVLNNGTNVTLSFASLPAGTYFVVVSNIRDASAAMNLIAPGSYVRVGYANQVLAIGAAWRYDDRAINYGAPSVWAARTYDDSSWKGPSNAVFAAERSVPPNGTGGTYANFGAPVGTSLILTNFTPSPPTDVSTYYFRTHFTSYASGVGQMTIRTILDDGAVIYLNGAEIFRLGMANGTPAYATLANRTVGDAAFEGPFTVPVTNVLAGDNVIAVEMHQVNLTSSDATWAGEFSLVVTPITVNPGQGVVQITTQPRSRTNEVGTLASFNVAATGGAPLFYQWRKNGVNLTNQTNTTLGFINVQVSDAGNYTVLVSNSFSSVTSVVATLTVTSTNCLPVAWSKPTLTMSVVNGTNVMLSWSNPAGDNCGNPVIHTLQQTLALSNTPATTPWANITTTSPYTTSKTNPAIRFFRLVPP